MRNYGGSEKMINLELYKIFVLVAKEGNITRASELMNISQPAVTKHIKNLENELNILLFYRNNGMKLTKKGKELFEMISPAIEILQKAEAIVTNNREINFGTYNTMVSVLLSESISQYYSRNENKKINIINSDIDNMIFKLETTELDIVVSKRIDEKVYDTSKIEYVKLGKLHDVLVTNKNSKLAKKKLVSIDELQDEIIYIPRNESISTTNFVKMIEKSNIKKIDSATMLKIVEKGEGIGFITKEYIENDRVAIIKTDFKIEASEYGIYLNKENNFKELKEFIEILKRNTIT